MPFENNQFYVARYLGLSWEDSTGAAITLPPDLDDGLINGGTANNIMYLDSYEVTDISEFLGNESTVYVLGNGFAVQQSMPKPRRWDFAIQKINPATDEKINTLTTNQAFGYIPTARITTGYRTGDAGTGQWTSSPGIAVLDPCAIEYVQLNGRNIGRGSGILHDVDLSISIYQSVVLTVPSREPTTGGGQ